LETLAKAGGVWFGGGRQWRFVDAYSGTRAESALQGVLKRGGVIGGSSAGASIQASFLARGNPLGNRDIIARGYERGLGFLPGTAIDQHFSQRKRLADMSFLVERHPQLLGIGIDEATALVVRGHMANVVGRNRVYFYNRRGSAAEDGMYYDVLGSGGKYDLKQRRIAAPMK
jgi:cyanophycinase